MDIQDVLDTIKNDLIDLCEDNEVMKDTIREYFDSSEYELSVSCVSYEIEKVR